MATASTACHTAAYTCCICSGVEQAVHWLMSNEAEADAHIQSARASQPTQATQQHQAAPALTASGAGVAGILRREAQQAAQNDE